MLVSLSWLNEYIDLSGLTPQQIAASLTDIGLEVEGIEKKSAIGNDVVVGRIVSADKHPNADALKVCKVDVGEGQPLDIVCGAPNARTGLQVVVAKVGSTLPGDFKIKKTKIRGEASNGMMCSEKELGLSENHEGIIELADSQQLGAPAAAVLGLEDTVLELGITPNRADCLGYIGIARDLAAKLKRTLRQPQRQVQPSVGLETEHKVKVEVENSDTCYRFVALYIQDVQIIPSPAWMQKRLEASGMRPINLVVDATNYAMLEYSQPIHAYDERDVAGSTLKVRAARTGETLKTLDGQTRALVEGDILICDAEKPIGLAGIMGGENSEVKADTRNIIIEVAAFAPLSIRKTARRLGLHTEASHRFERGIDVDSLAQVAWRVAELISLGTTAAQQKAPEIAGSLVDHYGADIAKRVIALRVDKARQMLALSYLTSDQAKEILIALQFELLDSAGERMVFEVPHWRGDIEREVDLIEEIGRIYGFDKIPYQMPTMGIRPTPEDPFIDFVERARLLAAAAGFKETISFPFLSRDEFAALQITENHPLYPSLSLKNPLSEEQGLMQTTLIPNLVRAIQGNRRRSDPGQRLFECGRGYFAAQQKNHLSKDDFPAFTSLMRPGRHLTLRAREEGSRPIERHWLAGIIDQPWTEKSWDQEEKAASFYHGKKAVWAICQGFGVHHLNLRRPKAEELPFLHPGASAVIETAGPEQTALGFVGELHPLTAAKLDLNADDAPVVFELDLERLFEARSQATAIDPIIRRFPPVTRDIALLVDTHVNYADFETAFASFPKKRHLHGSRLFDLYVGSHLPSGKKSMAYTLYFQSPERTLTEKEVETEINALTEWLKERLGATQR